jgi:arsenite oxidase small subunit
MTNDNSNTPCGLDRRAFLQRSTAGATTILLGELFAGRVLAQDADQAVALQNLARVRIATQSQLTNNEPELFDYPSEGAHSGAMLVKLGKRAGGGIGPGQDIVAFSTRCTHMGGDMSDGFVGEYQAIGCGEHLTTFDLTRHGLVIAGHATSTLPQIVLELDGDDIYAIGIIGLLFGHHRNPSAAP